MRSIWLKNFEARDLLECYEGCMRDASVKELSAHGRFAAARDALIACAAIVLKFDGSRDLPTEQLLLDFAAHESVGEKLGLEITKLGFDWADYSLGFTLADEAAAQRARECALAAHAVASTWLQDAS